MLAVVLLASALFFAGISTKLHRLRQREALLALGWLVFLGTVLADHLAGADLRLRVP